MAGLGANLFLVSVEVIDVDGQKYETPQHGGSVALYGHTTHLSMKH